MKKTSKNKIVIIALLIAVISLSFVVFEQYRRNRAETNKLENDCLFYKSLRNKDSLNYIINNERVSSYNNLSIDKNFSLIFYNRNDSVYKIVWNNAYENDPETAFLLACSYYYVTKETDILLDIEKSSLQINEIYSNEVKN